MLVLAGLSIPVAAAEIVYVSSKQTNIYQNANLNSGLLATLNQNDQLEVINQQGVWIQVRVADRSGWVSRYSVSSAKPFEKKVSIFSRLKNFFRDDNKRARLTLVSTAGGIRGLTEEESDAIGRTDFAAVEIMETIAVSEAEIDEFILSNRD